MTLSLEQKAVERINAEEIKRQKARNLRYKKPIVKDLNLENIRQELWDIQEECESVHWYFDTDEDTLINALDGNEDEAYEFRMMFGDLCAECERMLEDLDEEWIPEYFDYFFVALGVGEDFGGLLGYDSYEQDYFGLSCIDAYAEDEGKKVLKRLTKEDLIAAARQCFKVYQSFIALRHRYDCLKAAIDILREQNTGYLQMVKQIDEVYEKAEKASLGFHYNFCEEIRELDRILENMPQEAWIQ